VNASNVFSSHANFGREWALLRDDNDAIIGLKYCCGVFAVAILTKCPFDVLLLLLLLLLIANEKGRWEDDDDCQWRMMQR